MNSVTSPEAQSILQLACALQQIASPTFHEEPRAAFMAASFRELDLCNVQIDSTGNALARLPGTDAQARPVVISAHLDTVHPLGSELSLESGEGRITGRAIGDNSLGLAALIGLVTLLKARQAQLPGDLWLVANTCEEGLGDLRGMRAVVDRFGADPLAYLVLEGMGLGGVLHRGLGVERYRITVQTPGGHSWTNYGDPSAIHELASLITQLAELPLPKTPATSLNVGTIQGGNSINSIAAQASCELDLRSEDEATLQKLVRQVTKITSGINREKVTCTLEQIGKRQAGAIEATHPLITLAQEVLAECGVQSRLEIGSTDANLPLSQGYAAVCVGITYGDHAHTAQEYIVTEPIALGMTQVYEIVTRIWDRVK